MLMNETRMRPTMLTWLRQRIQYAAVLAVILLALSQLLGRAWWFAELFSHFLLHAVLLWTVAVWAARGKWRMVWAVCALLGAAVLWLPQTQRLPEAVSGQLIWYNVHLHHPQPEAETQRLLALQPDVVALAEIDLANPRWQALRQALPFGCEYESASPFALALYARAPLASCEVHFVADYPYIRATWSQADAVIYALHPPPPITRELAAHRQQYLQHTATRIAQEQAVLVVGDLNSTPYSPIFRDFVAQAQLNPHTKGHIATWHLGLNIDHVLSRNVPHSLAVKPLDWGESDHRALRVILGKWQ